MADRAPAANKKGTAKKGAPTKKAAARKRSRPATAAGPVHVADLLPEHPPPAPPEDAPTAAAELYPDPPPGGLTIRQRYDPAIDVEQLLEHPENAREGDMDAIDASLTANGFYGAIYIQESTGLIVAGNHRFRAAVERGKRTVPGIWMDLTDTQARRILAVDQRTAQKGGVNEERLARLLGGLAETPLGLAGSGYTPGELAALRTMLGEPDDEADRPAPLPRGSYGDDDGPDPTLLWPRIDMTVPADVHDAWTQLLGMYDAPTDPARLRAHLEDIGVLVP